MAPLASWLAGLEREQEVTHLALAPLMAEDTTRLVASLASVTAGAVAQQAVSEDPGPPRGPRQLRGQKLGDRRVRVERPHSAYFRYTGEGTLVAKQANFAGAATLTALPR